MCGRKKSLHIDAILAREGNIERNTEQLVHVDLK
jgi:hypothetical protein